jgi:hypothetical protein
MEPRPKMELAGIIIGTVALVFSVMALPSAFQMFWGRPRLGIEVSEANEPNGKRLFCQIFSVPVQSRILLRLGVRREAAVISATFEICESGTNHVMLNTAPASLVDLTSGKLEGSFRATVVDHLPIYFSCLFRPMTAEL